MRELPDLLENVERDREIAAIRERLAQLESEKAELEGSLNKLLAAQEAKDSSSPASAAPVTNASSPAAKKLCFARCFEAGVTCFRSAGRIPGQEKQAMPRPAPTNGCRASAENRR